MIRTILVPTDGSDYSGYAADYAGRLAQALEARIVLVSVVSVTTGIYDAYSEIPAAVQVEEVLREQVHRALDKEAARLRERGLEVRSLLRVGDVLREILDAVEEESADLVVIGTHGRKGLSRFLLGSTTEKLVRTAPCPVLTVRPPDAAAGTESDPRENR